MNKRVTSLSTIFFACFLASAQAQEAKDAHAGHQAAPQNAPDAPRMQKMNMHMQEMRDLMARIRTTQDPAVRKELLKQHREAMQAQMTMMKGMDSMGEGCGSMRQTMMDQMMEQMMEHMTQGETH